MGQRHQVYIRLRKTYFNKGNQNNGDEKTIGLHHLWCFGKTALKLLKNFLTFEKHSDRQYYPFQWTNRSDAQDILNSSYSFIPEEGYHCSVHTLDEDTNKNPLLGDNNDGITIIDLTGKTPKYCFMILPCDEDDFDKVTFPPKRFKPISAETYLRGYYSNFEQTKCDKDCDCHDDPKLKKKHDKQNKEHIKECQTLIKFLEKFELISIERLQEIFPDMIVSPNSVEFIKKKRK